jgi:hypothetical protein
MGRPHADRDPLSCSVYRTEGITSAPNSARCVESADAISLSYVVLRRVLSPIRRTRVPVMHNYRWVRQLGYTRAMPKGRATAPRKAPRLDDGAWLGDQAAGLAIDAVDVLRAYLDSVRELPLLQHDIELLRTVTAPKVQRTQAARAIRRRLKRLATQNRLVRRRLRAATARADGVARRLRALNGRRRSVR